MKYNKISANDRMRIIEAFNNEEDWKKLQKLLVLIVRLPTIGLKIDKIYPRGKEEIIRKNLPKCYKH